MRFKSEVKYNSRAHLISARMYEEWMEFLYERNYGRKGTEEQIDKFKKEIKSNFNFGAVIKRVEDHFKDIKNWDVIELTGMYLVRSMGSSFDPVKNFGPIGIQMVLNSVPLPREAWKYAVWADRLDDGKMKQSAEYWIDKWSDLEDSWENKKEVDKCKRMLDKLMEQSPMLVIK